MRKIALHSAKILCVAALVSCKTAPPDTEPLPSAFDERREPREDVTSVPVSLWSPGQRRAMAGYFFLAAEMMSLSERDAKGSLPIFEAAYGLDPTPFLGAKMITAKAAVGDRTEAAVEARKMVLLFPKDARLRYIYGQLLAAGGAAAEATDELERCISLDPDMESCYLDLIEVLQQERQTPKAIVVAKDLVARIPDSLAGWTHLARMYLIQQNYKLALKPAERAFELQSNNPQLILLYAVALQLSGKTKEAVGYYERLYRMNPTDDTVMTRMVELYREMGNLEDALALVEEMIQASDEDNHGVRMQKAILLWELERFEEASELLDRLSRDFPDSDRLTYMAGLGQERLKKYDAALETYKKVPEKSPFRYHADVRMLVILREQKKLDEAIAKAEEMLTAPELEWDIYGIIAGLYADATKYKEAVEKIDEGYKRFPDQHRLLFLKGVYQEKAGDVLGCIATMKEVIARDPTNSSAYNYLGYLYAERGENLEEAEKLVQKALELKPGDGFYLDSLGWVYFQKKQYDKALPPLLEAASKEPKEGVILEHLGDLKKATGDEPSAKDFYRKALEVDLEDKDRERVLKKLENTASGEK